jgi:hypothetical protein
VMVNKKNDCLHFCCVSAVMVCLIFQNGRFIQIESETFTRREFADVSSSHFFCVGIAPLCVFVIMNLCSLIDLKYFSPEH